MCNKMILEILTAIGTIGAVVIGMFVIYHSNENSKHEIKTHKLEEIFKIIQSLSKFYGKFNELYLCIEDLRDREKKEIQTLDDYYKIRDKKIPPTDVQVITDNLSRLEVLSKCYTEASLLDELMKFEDLMYSFSDLVFNGGSLHQELKWKQGFPSFEEYFSLIEGLKTQIINLIKQK